MTETIFPSLAQVSKYLSDGSYLIQDMRQYEEGQRLRTEMNHDGVFYFYDYDRNGNRVMSLCRTSEGECYIQKKIYNEKQQITAQYTQSISGNCHPVDTLLYPVCSGRRF